MAELSDVVNSLKNVEETIKNPPKSAAQAEAAAEAARAAADSKKIQLDILATLKAGVGGAVQADKKSGGLIAGLLGGIGAGIGSIGKAVSKIGPKFVIGMGSIALGIGAFLLGLGGAGKIAELAGFDGKALKELVGNVFGAFGDPAALATMVLVIGAAMAIDKLKVSKMGVALGMGAIGIGIASFVLGILAAEGFAKLGDLVALDGTSLATLMTNVFGAFDGIGIGGLTGLLAGAVVLDKVKGGKKAVMMGMGAIGGGVAAFTLGILAAEGFAKIGDLIALDGNSLNSLLSNFFSAFEGVGIEALGVTLIAAGVIGAFGASGAKAVLIGMGAIGGGIAAFSIGLLAGEGLAKIGSMLGLDGSNLKTLLTNVGEGIGGFIGGIGKGMFEQLKDLDSDKLIDLGKGIGGIGIGIAAFGAGSVLGVIGGVMEGLGSFFGVKSPIDTIIALSKDKDIDTKRLAELGGALGPLGEGIAAFAGFSLEGGFFSGKTDIEKFIRVIEKIGNSDANINGEQIGKIAAGIQPLGLAMSGFKGIDFENLDDIDEFFAGISAKNLSKAASPEQLKEVSKGIAPLAESMKSFAGIDMDAITGGLGEDNLGKFFKGVAVAAEEIKNPNQLKTVAIGIRALGEAMQTFKGIDGDQINTALEAVVGAGGSDKAIQIYTQSAQNAGGGGGGPVTINNFYNTDNSVQSSQSTAVSMPEPTRTGESTVRALQTN